MPNETIPPGPDPARNLQVLLGGAGLLYLGWCWANFSGPFRLGVDLQLRWFGSYSEPAAGIAAALAIGAVVWLAAALASWALPGLSSTAADALVALGFVAASIAALLQVWHLWHEATHMPRLGDPVQLVDLGVTGTAALPLGHVRVIGAPDRRRQVLGYSTGRYGMNRRWEAWAPLIAGQPTDPNAPVWLVATARAPDRVAASRAIHDNPEGLLLFDSVDTRTIYEARQAGLDMNERAFALYPDERVRFDRFTNAALLGSFVALFWALAGYGRIKERRAGSAPAPASPASPPFVEPEATVTPVDLAATPTPESARTPDAMLTRVGSGGAVAATLAGGLLWEVFGFFPPVLALLGYAAAALVLVLSMLLIWLGQRLEAPAQPLVPPPERVALSDPLAPPPGAALLCVLRDEPGVSSPSYKRVDVDGARVADLQANRYTAVALRPGPHTLAVNTRISLTSDTVVRFDVAAGEVVVYRLQVPFFGALRLDRAPDGPELRAALKRLRPVAARDASI